MVLRKTLAFRIIALSSIWIVIALAITAMMLVSFNRDHMAQHYDAHVAMHLEELTGASQLEARGAFSLAFNPSDPRYQDINSGWYWEVKQSGKTLKRSPSLGEYTLNLGIIEPTENVTIHEIFGPGGEALRVHTMSIKQAAGLAPLVFIATAPVMGILEEADEYSDHIIMSFMALGLGLLLTVVIQVRVALKPLKAISNSISDIREGKAIKLPEEQLEDVQPLVDELNNLLDHNAVLVKRARNQLGDLAHAVKNPLTVITNEAQNMEPGQRELIIKQTSEIGKNVNHYLSRARAFGTQKVLGARSSVKAATEDMVYVMGRIYKERELEYDLSGLQGCWFRGEAQDLEEMMGNLIDNASKWAKTKVVVNCGPKDGRLEIVVEDDGPGIPEEEFEGVMRRGHKLDESIPGHGQGLGIVKDISGLYGGLLQLGTSELGGLRASLVLPAA
jgi:signal transduction histidine kinase